MVGIRSSNSVFGAVLHRLGGDRIHPARRDSSPMLSIGFFCLNREASTYIFVSNRFQHVGWRSTHCQRSRSGTYVLLRRGSVNKAKVTQRALTNGLKTDKCVMQKEQSSSTFRFHIY